MLIHGTLALVFGALVNLDEVNVYFNPYNILDNKKTVFFIHS